MTFFIMIIILAVVLFISILLYSEVKIIKNMGDSVSSLFAADSGIEKVLFYDRKVVPTLTNGKTPARGLCIMYDETNPEACTEDGTTGVYSSLHCNNQTSPITATNVSDPNRDSNGCDPTVCDDCQISFNTTFDNRTYSTTAKVYPASDGTSDFEVVSKGSFGVAERQLKIIITAATPEAAIIVKNACATPSTTYQGTTINISTNVSATTSGDSIGKVVANIYDAQGNLVSGGGNLSLSLVSGNYTSGNWQYCWHTDQTTTAQSYFVNIKAQNYDDSKEITLTDIQPYPFCVAPGESINAPSCQ